MAGRGSAPNEQEATKTMETVKMRPRYGFVAAVGLLLACAACSFILDHGTSQCSSDGDCAAYAPGAVCRDSVCVNGTLPDAASESGVDAGPDGPCQKGGFAGDPTTNDQFLNRCTTAMCVPFDNCDKLGLCGVDAGFLPSVDPDGGASTTANPDSGAVVSCEDTIAALPGGGTPVYVTGSSNFPGFLKLVAPLLAQDATPHYVVWQQTNSCTGVDSVFNAADAKHMMYEGPGKSTVYYDAMGNAQPCVLNVDVGTGVPSHKIDIGESDVFADSCAAKLKYQPMLTTAIGSYTGPIQAIAYLVPGTSTQRVISAEAAQAVYGHGGVPDDQKLPWTMPTQFFTRSESTGTNQLVSRAMSVDPTKWWGVDKKTASGMVTQLKAVPPALAEKTLGVVSTDLADKERGNVKVLAFQAKGQSCGFWPDSTPFATDKRNVRDGHYPIWGPLHFYTRLLSGGVPTDAAGALVQRFSVPRLEQSLVEAIAKSGNVPQCAMGVSRDVEMGDIQHYASPYDCNCIFEQAATAKAPPECRVCARATDCPSERPACNYGFCEAH
jgi:ABC-type phosphate transport system substrate-binding protein